MSFFDRMFDRAIVGLLPLVPKGIVGRVAKRYVAGDTLVDAMRAVDELKTYGCMATMDVLGEEIERLDEADATRDEYLALLDNIDDKKRDANISIKLTGFGLRLDSDACYRNVKRVLDHARSFGNFVRIDMEDSSTTTNTLNLYRRFRDEGYDNLGVVIQAYMRRSLDDVESLRDLKPNYRLCKGIYNEAEEIAYKDGAEINDNYVRLLEAMFDGGSYIGIATHDKDLVERSEKVIRERSLEPDAYEYQMLLGVTEELRRQIVAHDHRLRVYVPYGPDWYAYCVRRLKENPKIGRYVFFAMFKKK